MKIIQTKAGYCLLLLFHVVVLSDRRLQKWRGATGNKAILADIEKVTVCDLLKK